MNFMEFMLWTEKREETSAMAIDRPSQTPAAPVDVICFMSAARILFPCFLYLTSICGFLGYVKPMHGVTTSLLVSQPDKSQYQCTAILDSV